LHIEGLLLKPAPKVEDKMTKETSLVIPVERIQQCIYMIRKQKVILDSDLALLYGVETKALVRAVKRNINRFPDDFMFQLKKVGVR
jgi:hypothetical protein